MPKNGFSGFSLSGKDDKNVPALLTALIEENIEINGIELKQKAYEMHGISKGKVDQFLKTWPHERRGAKGNEKIYFAPAISLAA